MDYDFGYNIVLGLTDNASAGLNNFAQTLEMISSSASGVSKSLGAINLATFSMFAQQLGSSVSKAGSGIFNVFKRTTKETISVGQTLMYAGNQLSKLYESDGEYAGLEKLQQIKDYAKQTTFEFENLLPAVITLKAAGVEAFDAIGKSIEGADLNILDYASDLAAFKPQMHNQYGSGINASIGAFIEYIAEGNKKSLLSGAGLDILALLGEDKGKTIEERTQQIVRLMEK